jgi:hypothetical protein
MVEVKRPVCANDSPAMLGILVDLVQPEFTIVGTLSSGFLALTGTSNLNPCIILDVDLGV